MIAPAVLIGYSACPLTRQAFEAAGCEAWTCDLLPARDGSNRHIQGDVWDALRSRSWDMAVLHPMCTYLTVSAAWAYGDGPYHQRVKPGTLVGAARRAARDDAIENFRHLLDLPFPVAAENPAASFLSKSIRPADQIVHPFHFGDDASKATGWWLTRGVPLLRKTEYVPPRWLCCGIPLDMEAAGRYGCANCHGDGRPLPRWGNQTDSGQNKLTPSDTRWLERAKTYPGMARAIGSQWGMWLINRKWLRNQRKSGALK